MSDQILEQGMSAEDESLYDLSDEELEQRFREAKQDEGTEESVDEDLNSDEEDDIITVTEDEEDEELSVDNLEQPNEDDGQEDSNDETESEPTSEEDEITDSDADTADEQLGDDKDEEDALEESEESKGTEVTLHKVKANGMDFEFTTEELIKLAPKSMNFTKKMQEIAPWRKTISAMSDNDITKEDVDLLIEMKQGNKEAIAKFMKNSDLDVLDLDVTEETARYQPNSYGADESELALQDIESRISRDTEYATTVDVVNRQWDEKSRDTFRQNPTMIEELHTQIKSGAYAMIAPEAMKLKLLEGDSSKSDVDYYNEAAARLAKSQQQQVQSNTEEQSVIKSEVARQANQKSIKKASTNRKAASPTKSKAGGKKVIDYLDDNDDSYDQWYTDLMNKA